MNGGAIEGLHPNDEEQRSYVLVTGVNSGLGFAICCRLIDEFITTRPWFQSLTLVVTTRDKKKSDETISRLQRHVRRKSKELDILLATRITLEPESLDLTSLNSVYTLAAKLLKTIPHLDTIILNAGSGGIVGLNWPNAIWTVLTDTVSAVSYPTFKLGGTGFTTAPQTPLNTSSKVEKEEKYSPPNHPPLGQVFTSNLFGHYSLTHQLLPLLSSSPDSGRIIFISSLEAYPTAFDLTDLQGLRTPKAYESSKRLTDLLILTSNLPSTAPFTKRFFAPSPTTPPKGIQLHDNDSTPSLSSNTTQITLTDNTSPNLSAATRPKLYLTHPGICSTSFIPLSPILYYLMTLSFYLARWLGSPWHTVSASKGAKAPVWLALTSQEEMEDLETEGGKGKWGSACDWRGREEVLRTGVGGWGVGGHVGEMVEERVMGLGQGSVGPCTREGRGEFEAVARECWRMMEELRVGWEEIMGVDG